MKIVAVAFSVRQENSIGYRKFEDWAKLAKWLSLVSEQADFVSLRFIKEAKK